MILFFRFLCVCAIFAAPYAWAQSAFETNAPHAIIIDHNSGIVLYEKDARDAIAPSSMTKIMTADIVFEQLKSGRISLTDTFTVSQRAFDRKGSSMFLRLGSKVSVENLLRGVIVQSGNDASIALAEGVAGTEERFAEMMTSRAKALGLKSASFKNSTGWPHPEHKISTYDLAKLARHSIESYPEFYPLYSEREFTWDNVTQSNRNPILGAIDGADGLKTGHTETAGYGLVGTAIRDGQRRIIVINGLESKSARRDTARSLMNAAFTAFDIIPIRKKNDNVAQLDVYLGKQKTVNAIIPYDINMGIAKTDIDAVHLEITYAREIVAPIQKGQEIGKLTISAPGQLEQTVPLLAAESVPAKGGVSRALSVLSRKIKGK